MVGNLLVPRNTEMNRIVLDLKEFIVYSIVFIAYLFEAVFWYQNMLTRDHFSSAYQSVDHVYMKELSEKYENISYLIGGSLG